MRLVFMGSPDLAAVILQMLYENGCEIAGVVTGTDKTRGRKSALIPTEVGKKAQELGLPLLKTPKVRRPEDLAWIRSRNADAVIVAAFGQLLPSELLNMTRFGCINVHASLLPAYRGAAPIQWSVLNGDEQTGVTIMQMDEGLDTGDILTQAVVPILKEDTSGTLFDKMAEAGGKLLLETLPMIENGTVKPVKQPAESTTPYAGRITKEMGRIDWSKPAVKIDPWIRGMNPWPCAYTCLDGKMLKIWGAEILTEKGTDDGAEPGMILSAGPNGIAVQTGKGGILLKEVQLEGKKRMSTSDFLRGYRIRTGKLGGD